MAEETETAAEMEEMEEMGETAAEVTEEATRPSLLKNDRTLFP